MKTLFVCSEFYAGMLPFGANIVNSMRGDDCFAIFVCTPACDYRKAIVPNEGKYVFIDFPEEKFKKLQRYLYSAELVNSIDAICRDHNIEVIHLLTEDTSLALFIKKIQKRAEVYYTVHDLFAHEKVYKNILIWVLRKVLVDFRVKYLIRQSKHLVTSSKLQYEWMIKNFPSKTIHFHNFPTLVTEAVQFGKQALPELDGVKNYILFFGQVEQYKGVHLLYNAFTRHPELKDRILVIAGKGHIYFKRSEGQEKNVIFINRYIDDGEIRNLYRYAFCAVFPYSSGTQSGILSLPYFFKVPTIVSDIPFFKQFILNNITSLVFDLYDERSLVTTIQQLNDLSVEKLKSEAYLYYQKNYDPELLMNQLRDIYKYQPQLEAKLL